jgi:crotonobetainyl-CoA:carnitine CoA-transferase CaiB-like acyl-CoA transferase
MLSLLKEDQEWPVLADGIGRADLTTDPRFATRADRHAHARGLVQILDAIFAEKDFAEWRRMLDAKGLIFGFAATLDDVVADRQMLANDVLVSLEGSDMLTINSPLWVEGAAKVPPHLAPAIGEHSEEVLRELGYDDDQIRRLRQSGVINK